MWMKIGLAFLGCAEDLLDEGPMLGRLQFVTSLHCMQTISGYN